MQLYTPLCHICRFFCSRRQCRTASRRRARSGCAGRCGAVPRARPLRRPSARRSCRRAQGLDATLRQLPIQGSQHVAEAMHHFIVTIQHGPCQHAGWHAWRAEGVHLPMIYHGCRGACAETSHTGIVLRQVVQVCAEHKKPKKLLKHMTTIKAQSAGQRNPPRTLVFANRVRHWLLATSSSCNPLA